MNKYVLWGSLFLLIVSTMGVEAQLINHERRAKYQGSKQVALAKVATVTPVFKKAPVLKARYDAPKVVKEAVVLSVEQEFIRSNIAVTKRSERVYDYNQDGIFQEDEIKEYLNDVADTVEARGQYSAKTKTLKYFDANNDGRIKVDEVDLIKAAIQ
ncbi:MAG: hypothetical protein ACI9F2_000121 [Lysobacterales bacterium]|jgi:hypothetical protein